MSPVRSKHGTKCAIDAAIHFALDQYKIHSPALSAFQDLLIYARSRSRLLSPETFWGGDHPRAVAHVLVSPPLAAILVGLVRAPRKSFRAVPFACESFICGVSHPEFHDFGLADGGSTRLALASTTVCSSGPWEKYSPIRHTYQAHKGDGKAYHAGP